MTIAATAARALVAVSAAAALAACESGGTSSADAERAAEQQVRERYGLAADVPLETTVVVGEPRDGETILCGTVRGAGGEPSFPAQRFVAETDPTRFLKFQPASAPTPQTAPNMFVEWEEHCAAAGGNG